MSGPQEPLPTNSKGPSLLATQYTVVPLATIITLTRLYARCIRRKAGGWDDILIFVATALSIWGMACGQVFVDWGMGQHVWNLPPKHISLAIKWLTIAELCNYGGLCLVRLSVGFFLLRLIPISSTRLVVYRWFIIGAMIVNVMASIAVIGVFATQCVPLAGLWDTDIPATCFSASIANDVNRLFSSISAAIDFTFALLPLTIVLGLQMNTLTKISTAFCLSLGFLTGVCAVVKASIVNVGTADPTYDLSDVTICAILEVNVGIIAACLPGMRQFILVFTEDVRSLRTRLTNARRTHTGRNGSASTADSTGSKIKFTSYAAGNSPAPSSGAEGGGGYDRDLEHC